MKAAASFVGLGVTQQNIIPGNGSTEIIRLVVNVWLKKEILCFYPGPLSGNMRCNAGFWEQNLISGQDEVETLPDEVLERAKILFICNPNNPTGKLRSREEIKALAELCRKHGTLLFVDEAFIELSDPAQVLCGSCSKQQLRFCYALPYERLCNARNQDGLWDSLP